MHSSYKKKWQILFVTTCSSMLVYLDISAIPIAIPALEKEFSLSPVGGLWIVNAYLLTLLAFFLLSGKLADIFGKKKIFLIGFALFGLASLLAGLSTTGWWLIVSRGLQGIGGALSFPTMTALLLEHFPVNERAKAMGINSGISSISLILGPAVGGFFVQYLSWRYIFWINLPIIICGLIVSFFILPSEKTKEGKIHLLGAFFAMIGPSALVIALMEGGQLQWTSSPVVALLSIAIICALLFFYVSKDAQHPLIEFSLLRNFRFNVFNLCIFLLQIVICFNIFLAIYLQKQLNYTPVQTGMLIVEGSLPAIFFSPLSGYLSDHFTPRIPLIAGSILLILGFGLFFIFLKEAGYFYKLIPLLMISSGVSLIRSPSFSAAIAPVPSNHLGAAVTLIKANRQFAATLSLALIAAVIKKGSNEASYQHGIVLLLTLFTFFSILLLLISSIFTNGAKDKNEH